MIVEKYAVKDSYNDPPLSFQRAKQKKKIKYIEEAPKIKVLTDDEMSTLTVNFPPKKRGRSPSVLNSWDKANKHKRHAQIRKNSNTSLKAKQQRSSTKINFDNTLNNSEKPKEFSVKKSKSK